MNIMNCLGSATVPKSLALQSQGWSFAATLRAGETEQQGWKIESYAATWVIEASASTCGPYWMLLYWMQPQNLRFLICVLRGSMGIWCEWWNPVFLYLGPRTCFFWRPLLIILFCPWHKNRPWKHTPCKIQEDFWVLCSTNLVQTYVCKLNIKLDIYLRTYIYIYTLGAGGSPKVLWVGYCEWLKIVISLWRNVSFWRSHSLHRIVFCADEFFLIRVLIDQKSIIHTFIFVRNVWFVW